MYKVNKSKCLGCGACVSNCSGGMEMGPDNKAEIRDQKKLEECGGESVCPMGAIEEVSGEGAGDDEENEGESDSISPAQGFGKRDGRGRGPGRGLGQGLRNGSGKGFGRGLGLGRKLGR